MSEATRELPRYKSHKTVWALKIAEILETGTSKTQLVPEDQQYGPVEVDAAYMHKHRPEVGGYYVRYADGYQSYSPAKDFEEGYSAIGYAAPAEPPKTPYPAGVEDHIKAAGADKAPRITEEHIAACIASEWYINAGEGVAADGFQPPAPANHPLRLLTICVLVLRNGFTVTGESACASPENFNAEIGRRIARENAVEKVWLLEGYLLRQMLHDGSVAAAA